MKVMKQLSLSLIFGVVCTSVIILVGIGFGEYSPVIREICFWPWRLVSDIVWPMSVPIASEPSGYIYTEANPFAFIFVLIGGSAIWVICFAIVINLFLWLRFLLKSPLDPDSP